MRLIWPFLVLYALIGKGQPGDAAPGGPLRFTGTVSAPQNASQILDHAVQAWRFSFGQEPGARMEVDTAGLAITGTARFNFRSLVLNGREETMGPIAYRIRIAIANGECRWTVEEVRHTGNRNAAHGGADLGLLTTSTRPPLRLKNMSYPATLKVWEDAKTQLSDRVEMVRRNFESQMRRLAGL